MLLLFLSWRYLAFLVCITRAFAASDYYERLDLRPLPESSLLASFSFRSNATIASFEEQNFRFFPRPLGQILQHTNTKELHLRFSSGRWDEETWGARPRSGSREGGTGVELWAWVDADTVEECALPSFNETCTWLIASGRTRGG
jgi:phosphatidylinositol glycan class T